MNKNIALNTDEIDELLKNLTNLKVVSHVTKYRTFLIMNTLLLLMLMHQIYLVVIGLH